jgi:hypothetical protein
MGLVLPQADDAGCRHDTGIRRPSLDEALLALADRDATDGDDLGPDRTSVILRAARTRESRENE